MSDSRETGAVELPASVGGELGDFTSAIRRQKWVMVVVAAVVAIAGCMLVLRRPATWTSTATMLVPQRDEGSGGAGSAALVDLSTERQVMRSETVAAVARERLAGEHVGLEDADNDDLTARVAVEVPVDTRVLRLTARGDDARQARAVARAFVSAYRDLSYLNAIGDRNSLIDVVEGELSDAQEDLDAANDALADASSGSVAELEARSRRSVVTDRITSLQDRRNELLATPLPQVRVLTPAAAATTTDKDLPLRDLALPIIAALVLGTIAAIVWDRFDDRVRDGDAIEKALGAPLLAAVPGASGVTDLVVADDPAGPAADAYRQLRVGVLGSPEIPGGTILVSGVRGGEGMADVAANLAMALAATGRSVAVVTVDGEQPDVAARFEVDGPGLAEVLSGVVEVDDALLRPRWLPVSVLPRGSRDVPVSDLVQSDAMHRLHRTLLAETDFVLLAAPPVLSAVDAVAMASLADAAVVVTSARRTSARDLRSVRARMARVGFPVIGAVLHGAPVATRPGGTPPAGDDLPESLPPAPPADDGAEAPVHAGAHR